MEKLTEERALNQDSSGLNHISDILLAFGVAGSGPVVGCPGSSAVENLPAMQEMQETGFDPWVGKTPWRRARPPTPVFLPGESHGWRSLVDYSPWGRRVRPD